MNTNINTFYILATFPGEVKFNNLVEYLSYGSDEITVLDRRTDSNNNSAVVAAIKLVCSSTHDKVIKAIESFSGKHLYVSMNTTTEQFVDTIYYTSKAGSEYCQQMLPTLIRKLSLRSI